MTANPIPTAAGKSSRRSRFFILKTNVPPELSPHYNKNVFPGPSHAVMDPRRWGPGERLVFEPYTKEMFEESFRWIAERGIFPNGQMGSGHYESAVVTLAV